MQQNSNQKLSPAAAMIILVCVMIIFTISLLYISNQKPKDTNTDKTNTQNSSAQPVDTEETTEEIPTATTKYSNATYNLAIDFASAYKSTTSTNDNGTRIDFNLTEWKATLLIDVPKNEELIRSMYEIGQEDDITINGITATRIIGSSIKDASLTYIYILTHENQLYVFYSTSANIQSVAKSISFSK